MIRLPFLIVSFLIIGLFPSPANASFLLPKEFSYSSQYGVDVKAKLTNLNSKSIDLVPGDVGVLEVWAEIVNTNGVSWPTEVFEWVSNRDRKIKDYSFKGYSIGAWVQCKDNENYFLGNNFNVVWVDLPWNSKSGNSSSKIKFPNKCNELVLFFDITPTIQNIILEGNTKVTGDSGVDYWQETQELSDEQLIGEINKHVNIVRWSPIENVTLGMKKVEFTPKASGGNVLVSSSTKNICVVAGKWILLARTGICNLSIEVGSSSKYDPVEPISYSFKVYDSIEIQCVKGSTLKLVKGTNPKCPKGYKKA